MILFSIVFKIYPIQAGGQPIAKIEWQMVDRFGLDNDQNNITDYDYRRQHIHPPSGYPVIFYGCESRGNVGPIVDYTWKIVGNQISYDLSDNSCRSNPVNLPEGIYNVTLTITTENGMTDLTSRTIVVKDLLIVSIGDSYASGEGNPDKSQRVNSFWGVDYVEAGPEWVDERCHRSAYAGPALAALELEQSDPHTSVTFLSYACSGAKITEGLLDWYDGVEPPSGHDPHELLAPQTWQATRDLCRGSTIADDPTCKDDGREVDFLIITAGGNDIGFSNIVKFCIVNENCHINNDLLNTLSSAFSSLPNKYDQLSSDINRRFKVSNTLITEYSDPTHNENGNYCDRILGNWPFGIGHNELQWASRSVLSRLNQAVFEAANRSGWIFVDNIASQFRTHGYCAGDDRWIVDIVDSRYNQGPFCCPDETTGTMHPNINGQLVYRNRLLDVISETPVPMPMNRLSLTVNPSTIIAKLPTPVTVYAEDLQTRVNGSVIIDGVVVGNTNEPFNYTFNRSSVGAKVVAPNYLNASIGFNINNKLDVAAIPNIVDFSSVSPINITISATSPATHQPIEGKVMTNEGRTLANRIDKEIGLTNVLFPHMFEPHIKGTPVSGLQYEAPKVIVVAPTYDNTPVRINFTNIPAPDVERPDDGPPDDGPPDDPCELSPTEMRPECRRSLTD